MSTYLGIDPSSCSRDGCGFCLLDECGAVLVIGAVPPMPRRPMDERLEAICQYLEEIFNTHTVCWAMIEDQHYQYAHATAALSLVRGVLWAIVRARGNGALLCAAKPSEWRKVLGLRSKDDVLRWAEAQLSVQGLPFSTYSRDEMEAYAIAECLRRQVKAAICE